MSETEETMEEEAEGGLRAGGCRAKKQEPHTEMWGKDVESTDRVQVGQQLARACVLRKAYPQAIRAADKITS